MSLLMYGFQFSDVVSIETLIEKAQDIGGQRIGYINQYDEYEGELKSEKHDYPDEMLERYKNSWNCNFLDIDIGSTVEVSFIKLIMDSDFYTHDDRPYVVELLSKTSIDTSLYCLLCDALIKMGGVSAHDENQASSFEKLEKERYPINLKAEKQRIKENTRKVKLAWLLLPVYIPLVLIALPVNAIMDKMKKKS